MGLKKLEKVEKPSIEDVIEKGGNVAADKEIPQKVEWKSFNLRLRDDISDQIDEALLDRVGLSKTAWILEAIQEKLKRSKDQTND